MLLTKEERLIYQWINACPNACQSYVDDNGNIIVTVETDDYSCIEEFSHDHMD